MIASTGDKPAELKLRPPTTTDLKSGIVGTYTPENWYICPHCHKKLLKQSETAQSQGLYIKCKGCGREVEIKIPSK